MKKHLETKIIPCVFYTLFFIIFLTSCHTLPFHSVPKRNPIVKNNYSNGRILIVPLIGKGDIGLYNKKGYFEKIWKTNKPTFYGELYGTDLFVVHIHKEHIGKKLIIDNYIVPETPFSIAGSTGEIAIYNYKGELKTVFEDTSLHHDIAIKNSTRIFALSWEVKTITHNRKSFIFVDESIIEIDLTNLNIVRRIKLSDYFSTRDHLRAKDPRRLNGIFHANGIDYIKQNPINGNEAILVTMRHLNGGTVILIDLKTNKLLWKSQKGLLIFPHDGKFTKEKTITVFDNGDFSKRMSRVLEIDITQNKVLWNYNGFETGWFLKMVRTFSPLLSGVQKIGNSYLVTCGNSGRIFEVSRDKKILWELPAAASFFHNIGGTLATEIFKARQYQ